MNKLRRSVITGWGLICLLLTSIPARADIVYPARLQLTETSPGVFEVLFILPVIQGKVLKAQPVFPDFCAPIADGTVQADPYQKKTFWQIRCESATLHGQQIGIEGLLGSPIDIILEIRTLEGRVYNTTLSANESYYLIPPPPGPSEFLSKGTGTAARNILLQWGLALMLLAALLNRLSFPFKNLLATSIIGASLGTFLSLKELLLVPSWGGGIAALLVSLTLILPEALGLKKGVSRVAGLSMLGLGAVLIGAVLPAQEVVNGFTPSEITTLSLFSLLGVSLGVTLAGLLIRQFLIVLSLVWEDYRAPLARVLTGLALGFLIWKLSLFWNYPTMLPAIPPALLVFAIGMATWLVSLSEEERQGRVLWIVSFFVLGFLCRVWDIPIPHSALILLFATSALLVILRFGKRLPNGWHITLLAIAGLSAGNQLLHYADESLSYPLARGVFMGILLGLITLIWVTFTNWIPRPEIRSRYLRITSAVLLILGLLAGGGLLLEAYREIFGFALSEGRLPLPYLSLGLLVAGLLLWPRHRKIHRQMGLVRKAPVASIACLTAAFYFLPVYAEVRNPWYTADNLDGEALQKLMEKKLWNTYTAFNIPDEEVLFEQLAENLDEALLDHIYLDSRRRLTMGLREGSEVTVQQVSLGMLGTPETGNTATEERKYPASWTVTAQVKHLKHIHYRKNQYTGTIALKPMDDGWKISEIILTSEDRQVIASGSL